MWISDCEEQHYTGLREHLLLGKRICRVLKPGEVKEVTIYANLKYSRTGVMLEKGGEYYFQIPGNQVGMMRVSSAVQPAGTGLPLRWACRRYSRVSKRMQRRYPTANWFEMIGAVGKNDENLLQILNYQDASHPYKALRGGELYAFPNDTDRQTISITWDSSSWSFSG